jgi:hypothetical protein
VPPPEELVCAVPVLVSGSTPVVEPALLPSDDSMPGVRAGTSVPVPAPATAAAVASAMSVPGSLAALTIVLPGGSVIDSGGDTVLSMSLSVLGPATVPESLEELLIPEIGEPGVEVIVVGPTTVVSSSFVPLVVDTVLASALV